MGPIPIRAIHLELALMTLVGPFQLRIFCDLEIHMPELKLEISMPLMLTFCHTAKTALRSSSQKLKVVTVRFYCPSGIKKKFYISYPNDHLPHSWIKNISATQFYGAILRLKKSSNIHTTNHVEFWKGLGKITTGH